MKLQHLALFGVIGIVWLVLSCQTNAPLEPLVGHDRPVLGAGDIPEPPGEPPKPPPMPSYKNFGECVGTCQDARHEFYRVCIDKGNPPKQCAEMAKSQWDKCVDQCIKNCEAECEAYRQEIFDMLLASGTYTADEAASVANAAAEKCKRKCKEPIKK